MSILCLNNMQYKLRIIRAKFTAFSSTSCFSAVNLLDGHIACRRDILHVDSYYISNANSDPAGNRLKSSLLSKLTT